MVLTLNMSVVLGGRVKATSVVYALLPSVESRDLDIVGLHSG